MALPIPKVLMVLFSLTLSVDFPSKYEDWAATDPLDLFQAQVIKNESNPKVFLYKYFLSVLDPAFL
ncbi:hypothetical protein GLYMA_18G003850v4 [Glycine max]|nr:hypothetical protein GLYMA_18G003850v4 [Glycine max]KAH1152531.1 hypothetical protein GYH30_048585 [Glycine max]